MTAEAGEDPHIRAEGLTAKRDRLLAALTLIAGAGLIVSLPFALRAGAAFFLPVTAALVIAIALVPMLEWFERRGVPSRLAAALCLILFLLIAAFAVGSIVLPAIDWVALVPQRIGKVREALEPVPLRGDRFGEHARLVVAVDHVMLLGAHVHGGSIMPTSPPRQRLE